MLINGAELLKKARRGRYAVGAFNINNLETLQGICEAAEKLKSPVIIQTTPSAIKYAGLEFLASMVKIASFLYDIPMVLHLDHGQSLEQVEACIEYGYTSVMIDGSMLPFEENIALTKKVVEIAHDRNISVEGELGQLPGKKDVITAIELMTNPAMAEEFVRKTNVDALAVAIGTRHGFWKGEEKINFRRLAAIAKRVKIPLVLHGGSGVSDEDIQKAIKKGIAKINIDTEIRMVFSEGLREGLREDLKKYDIRAVMSKGRQAVEKLVEEKIKIYGSAGKI
jgi:tagatose 1,6-diphosphate aldolase GatY/KbaY